MTKSQLIHLETLAQIICGNIIALVILYFYGMSLTQVYLYKWCSSPLLILEVISLGRHLVRYRRVRGGV